MNTRRPKIQRIATLVGLGILTATVCPSLVLGQQSNIDPYKPYSRNFQAYADPTANLRPGFPNPAGGSGRPTYGGVFDPFANSFGGFDPFSGPYYNRTINPSLIRSGGVFNRSMQDYADRPGRVVDPQERMDREYYDQILKRDDPYRKLEQKRDDLYFQALQEPDMKKRAELFKEYQRASVKSAKAFSSTRRSIAPVTPPRRTPGTAPAPTTRPRTTKPATGSTDTDARTKAATSSPRGEALERSDELDRELGLPSTRPVSPSAANPIRRTPPR